MMPMFRVSNNLFEEIECILPAPVLRVDLSKHELSYHLNDVLITYGTDCLGK